MYKNKSKGTTQGAPSPGKKNVTFTAGHKLQKQKHKLRGAHDKLNKQKNKIKTTFKVTEVIITGTQNVHI